MLARMADRREVVEVIQVVPGPPGSWEAVYRDGEETFGSEVVGWALCRIMVEWWEGTRRVRRERWQNRIEPLVFACDDDVENVGEIEPATEAVNYQGVRRVGSKRLEDYAR